MGDQVNQIQRRVPGPLPDNVQEDDIAKVTISDIIDDVGGSWDNVRWCPSAWSPDCMYFAYTKGRVGSVVELVPWNRYKNCLLSHDDRSPDGVVITLQTRQFSAGEPVSCIAIGSSQAECGVTRQDWSHYKYRIMHGLILAAGLRSGQIRVWNINENNSSKPLILMDHTKLISDLKFAPDGSLQLLSASYDGLLKVWNMRDDGNMYPTLRRQDVDGNPYRMMYGAAWSPDCTTVCGVGNASGVYLWDITTRRGRKLRADGTHVRGHHNDVDSCDFSPDGALLVTCSRDTKVLVWDPHTGDVLTQLLHLHPPPSVAFAGGANSSYVRSVSFCYDGRHVASICDDGYLRVWNLFRARVPVGVAKIEEGLCCTYSPHGATLLVGSGEGRVYLLQSPMRVSSLKHYCRLALRQTIQRDDLASLGIHDSLLHYLQYVSIDQETIPPLKERLHSLRIRQSSDPTL